MSGKNFGFSLAEIIIGLFIVSLITVLIGALGQQVAQFSNKTKQIGTVLELRTRLAAVSKDSASFIEKMQSVSAGGTSLKYQTCLQNAENTLSSFSCPPVKPDLLNPLSSSYDAELDKHANGIFKVTDTEIVDSNGEKIAGTIDNPFYLSADGFECSATPKNKKCPLMSTGYFFRSNQDTNSDPGSVKFVVKVQSNPEATLANSGTTPIKAQYVSIDLGKQWSDSIPPCPGASIQVGVRRDNSPMCLMPINCGANSILVGVKQDASPNCKSLPSCPSNKRIVLNDAGNLECVGNSPCDVGQAHLGYYSGTSDPICSSPASCSADQVLVGTRCQTIESCVGSERLTFENNTFSCSEVATIRGEQCTKPGEFLVGFDSNGNAKCEAGIAGKDGKDGERGEQGERGVAGEKGEDGTILPECDAGEVLVARTSGGYRCGPKLPECNEGQGIVAKDDGNYKCVDFFPDCKPGQTFVVKTSGNGLRCANLPQAPDPEPETNSPKKFTLRYEASQHNPAGFCASRSTRSCSYDLVSVDNNSVGRLTSYNCPPGHTASISGISRRNVNIPVSGGTVMRPLFGNLECMSSGGTTPYCPNVDVKATLTCTPN